MQRVQEHYSFYFKEQEKAQGKIGTEEILQILPEKHFAQRSKIVSFAEIFNFQSIFNLIMN